MKPKYARRLAKRCQSSPGIFRIKRAFAVDDFVMRQRQHKIFRERVDQAKR